MAAPQATSGFPAAQPAQRDQVVGGIQPVVFDAGQELRGLLGGPHRHRGPFPVRRHCSIRYGVQTTVPGWLVCSGYGSRDVDMVVTGTERG